MKMRNQREKKRFYLTGPVVSYEPSALLSLRMLFTSSLEIRSPLPHPEPLTLASSLSTLFLPPRYRKGPGGVSSTEWKAIPA